MSTEQISYRRAARCCGISVKAQMTGYIWETDQMGYPRKRTFNSTDVRCIEEATRHCAGLPVFTSAEHFSTSSEIVAKLTRMHAEKGIGFAVVDYIQKFTDRAETTEMSLGMAAHRLKDCFDSLRIPGVVLSQVNREANKRDTRFLQIGDSRGSGQIDEAADSLYGMSSQDYGKQNDLTRKPINKAEVSCLKDRLLGNAGKMIELPVSPTTGAIG